MTLQDADNRESCYRREIALLEVCERAQTGAQSGLRICTTLVFCN